MQRISDQSSLHQSMITWRHWLHQHPELALTEVKTSDYIAGQLQAMGLEVHRGLARTGLVASLKGQLGDGGSIALRADMDGLPIEEQNSFAHCSQHEGNMHACGHDGHSSMLLGAAGYLAENPNFAGTVHFIFQPAEEHIGGGRIMVEEGLFEQFPCEAVYGMHNWPGLKKGRFAVHDGNVMAAVESIHITVRGKGGHAAMPEQTIDPVVISAQLILALQGIVSRTLSPFESAVISITMLEGSDAHNVLPTEVKLGGTLRYFDEKLGNTIKSRMISLTQSICEASGGRGQISFEPQYPATINTPEHAAHCAKAAQSVVGQKRVLRNLPPSMGAEDFSYMLRAKPGAYIWIGNGPGEGGCMLHNDRYDFNDDILALGASYWVALVHERLGMASDG